jgi:hypothetical protein
VRANEASQRAAVPARAQSRSLRRLEVFLDIIYGLIAVHMLTYLPSARDMSWVGKHLGLLGAMVQDGRDVWRVLMGTGITAIAWYLGSKRLSQLHRTDFVHTTITLIQTLFVCFFVYFAICDPTLVGGPSSRALQSGSLALAGLAGQLAWRYARWRQLVDADTPAAHLDGISEGGRTEMMTAVLNTPLSWVGPMAWTIGWFVIPLALTQALPRLRRVRRPQPQEKPRETAEA